MTVCMMASVAYIQYTVPTLMDLHSMQAHLIELRNIIVDAKSGVSGAGSQAHTLIAYLHVTDMQHHVQLCMVVLFEKLLNLDTSAGRGAKEANLYTEIAEGIHSYGITKHRHGTFSYLLHRICCVKGLVSCIRNQFFPCSLRNGQELLYVLCSFLSLSTLGGNCCFIVCA